MPTKGVYTFKCTQLFNTFGAPGVPAEFELKLYRDGRKVEKRTVLSRWRAERIMRKWAKWYGAGPV